MPALCASVCLGLALLGATPATRATTLSIDGISDQNIPFWDGGFYDSYFADLFRRDWVADDQIRYARYVVQWNVMSGAYAEKRADFEIWLRDVASLGLTPDVALTSYDHVYPRSADEYALRLSQILSQASTLGHPVPYVEAWNEPNNQGHLTAPFAARLANAAQALCTAAYRCAVIAGDFEDAPGLPRYERQYERNLSLSSAIWGAHPYRSVEAMSESPYLAFLHNLPHEGAGQQVWITEIAARRCTDYAGALHEHGEAGQARRAAWLLDTLMAGHPPAHAFYYEFLLGGSRQPACGVEPEDGALYAPAGVPGVADRPRAAAATLGGGGVLAGYDEPLAAPGLPADPGAS
jgi:hypothetical protein